MLKTKNLNLAAAVFILLLPVFLLILVPMASAGSLASATVRFDRIATSTPTTGTVCTKPASVGTEADVKVTFPTGYTVSSTASNWTVSTTTTGWPAGAVAWPGIATATTASGQDVTFPSSDLTVGTLYCFNWTNSAAISTSASTGTNQTGTITTEATGPTTIDTASYATATISSDQVLVTATVPPTFNFALGDNTDNFTSSLSTTSAVSTTGVGITLTTNAANGWIVWVKDANSSSGSSTKGALQSVTANNFTIPTNNSNALGSSAHATTNGTQDYGLSAHITTDAAGGGTITLDPAYDDGGTGKIGVLDPNAFRTVASSSGAANGDIINLKERATIDGLTPAANDYTDTITVIGAGSF